MGAFYSSVCLLGARRDEVRGALDRWLGGRGFVRIDRPPLFDLDAASERSAFILSLERWTVVLFSDYDEERRLIRELESVPTPLLYLWVYDSAVWGYDLFDADGYAGSFSSDPDEHISFSSEEAGTAMRPWANPAVVMRMFGERVDPAALLDSLKRRASFKEDVARAFCAAIGAPGALASYDELEAGTYDASAGAAVEQLLYERRDRARGPRIVELHAQRVTQRHPTAGGLETGTIEIPVALVRELERSRRRMRRRLAILRPVSVAARAWRGLLERWRRSDRTRPLSGSAAYRTDQQDLLNSRHGCRITLPDGVEPASTARKPSAVFGFTAARVTVAVNARRLDTLREVLRRPDRAEVVLDERYFVGPHQARWLRFRLPPGFQAGTQAASILALHVVATEQALYVFLYRVPDPGLPDAESKIRRTVESFRLHGTG